MHVSCSASSSIFGGFLLHIGDEKGCEFKDAVKRCGGAFVKYRELTKLVQDALQTSNSTDTDGFRGLEERIDSEPVNLANNDSVIETDTVNDSSNSEASQSMEQAAEPTDSPVEEASDERSNNSTVSVTMDSGQNSNNTESSIQDAEPQVSEVDRNVQSEGNNTTSS